MLDFTHLLSILVLSSPLILVSFALEPSSILMESSTSIGKINISAPITDPLLPIVPLPAGEENPNGIEEEVIDYQLGCGAEDEEEVETLATLLSIRMNRNGNNNLPQRAKLLGSKSARFAQRLDLLDGIWSIAIPVVPNDTVPKEYVGLIKTFLVHFLSLAWENDEINGSKSQSSEKLLDGVLSDFKKCRAIVENSNHSISKEPTEMILMALTMSPGAETNIVIDTAWVIANMVLGICNSALASSNFWARYIHVVNAMIFHPLRHEWGHPRLEVGLSLGGFDTKMKYKELINLAIHAKY